jgi:hypothetical protein
MPASALIACGCAAVVLALIVAVDGHREGEADDQPEECKGGREQQPEVLAQTGAQCTAGAQQRRTGPGAQPHGEEGERSQKRRVIDE